MLALRARAQRLTDDASRRSTLEQILHDIVALQGQLLGASALGLRARGSGFAERHALRAIEERRIVRTWLMRGTLHLVAADDLRWLLGLLGPVFAAGNRARHAQLGLDEALKLRGLHAIREILARHGPLSRVEIVERLQRFGIRLDRKTQAPIHLIAYAALRGVCCLGPERDGEATYVLLDDWVAPDRSTRGTPGELAGRYFAAFGPATLDDFAAWSGLPMALARPAVNEAMPRLAQVSIQGQTAFLPRGRLAAWDEAPESRSLRLIPAFDVYLLGYRSRDLAVPRELQRRLQRGGGWIHPAVVVEGRAVAAWSLTRDRGRGRIAIEWFEGRAARWLAPIEAEIRDIGRFLDLEIERPG